MPRPVMISALPVLVVTAERLDFPQVNGGLDSAGSVFRLRHLDTDVQLKAPVPHERAGPGVLGQMERQHEKRVALAHRQNDAPHLPVDESFAGHLTG